MASRLFDHLADEMEKVATVFEEGTSLLFGGSDGGDDDGDETSRRPPTVDDGAQEAASSFDLLDETGEDFFIDDGDLHSPLEGMAESVIGNIMERQVGPQTPWEHLQAFQSAITWSEPFILSLLAFHALVILTAMYVTSKGNTTVRIAFLLFVFLVVRCAEYLNAYGARHWEDIATQNYFDKGGIFIGIMLCAPLITVCLGMLVGFLREAWTLLGEVKRLEIERKRAKKNRAKKDAKEAKASSSSTAKAAATQTSTTAVASSAGKGGKKKGKKKTTKKD